MINMIKDKTKCKIVVGQNGLVWVKGDEDMEQLTREVIHLIEEEAHTSGLTNKIKNKLYLAIDGELPPEEVEEAEEEFVLEKPKLQNFKEELEQEEREAEEKKEKNDKPDIGEVIEEFKRKNKSKDNSLSLSDNSNNSFILNNK